MSSCKFKKARAIQSICTGDQRTWLISTDEAYHITTIPWREPYVHHLPNEGPCIITKRAQMSPRIWEHHGIALTRVICLLRTINGVVGRLISNITTMLLSSLTMATNLGSLLFHSNEARDNHALHFHILWSISLCLLNQTPSQNHHLRGSKDIIKPTPWNVIHFFIIVPLWLPSQ